MAVAQPEHRRRRRANGEGSLTQLPDGRWMARLDCRWVDGRRVRRALFAKTRAGAAQKLSKAIADRERGTLLIHERQSVEHYLSRWLEDSAKVRVRPSTYVSYASYVHRHLIPGLGHHQLTELTPQHVQAFLNRKLSSGLSARTVQYLRAILRHALAQAEKWGMVPRNVAALVDPPQARFQEIQPLTPDQVQQLLAGLQGDRLAALYITAIATGLRQGELLGLMWDDVDLDAEQVVVRRALQRVDGKPSFVEPKTTRSRRTIGLPRVAGEALRSHRRRQLEERLQAGPMWHEWGLLFAGPIGQPLHPSNVTHAFQSTLSRLGLPRQRFHDLRHCCASLMLAQDLSLKDVMETLGHSQISLTANLYGHLYAERRREVASRMDAILGVGSS